MSNLTLNSNTNLTKDRYRILIMSMFGVDLEATETIYDWKVYFIEEKFWLINFNEMLIYSDEHKNPNFTETLEEVVMYMATLTEEEVEDYKEYPELDYLESYICLIEQTVHVLL